MNLKYTVYREDEPIDLLVIGSWEEPDVYVGWTGGACIDDIRLAENNEPWDGDLTADEEVVITERIGWLYNQARFESIIEKFGGE